MTTSDLEFNKNEDQFKQLIFQLRSKEKKFKLGGGEKKIEEQHQKGKLSVRERIEYLLDKDSDFLEIGLFAGEVKKISKGKADMQAVNRLLEQKLNN